MPEDLRAIRRQIKAVENIHHITKGMQMVAAAKLKRVQGKVEQGKLYWEKMQELVEHVASHAGGVEHQLLEVREPLSRIGVLAIAGDKGLCGGYNSGLLRTTARFIDEQELPVSVFTVGRKAAERARRSGWDVFAARGQLRNEADVGQAMDIADTVRRAFTSGDVDELYVVFADFRSAMRTVPTVYKLLPLSPPETTDDAESEVEYIFEPEPEKLLARLLPRYLNTQVYHLLLESLASEHAARMTAMAAATQNAEEMLDRLTLQRNRARQASITKELLEITTGAEALRA